MNKFKEIRPIVLGLAKFVTEVQSGLVIDGKALRFSEFVEIWKRDYGSK